MTVAVVALAVLCAVLAAVIASQAHAHRTERSDMLDGFREAMREDADRHATERRELANRIQRPDILPQSPTKPRQRRVPPDAANLRRIGTVAPPADDKDASA